MIQENVTKAIEKSDRATIIKQIELQKEIVEIFKTFTNCFAATMIMQYMAIGIGISLQGFETMTVSKLDL